jgi:ABC-2 type transport system ATP-binding protein
VAAAIRTDGLTKYYGPVIGVEDLSLEVQQGEVFGFLGANGAGKTTTIRLLLDLLRPTRGSARVLGFDCHADSLRARRQIGYLPGEFPVYTDLTAGACLSFLASVDGSAVSPGYLQALLARFDVSDLDLRRRLRDHSHGMRRKIGLIQALMARPPVVILDEPTSGLDPIMVQAFRETIADLKRDGGVTVFLSSHVLPEVEATCDRVGLIRGGRLATAGTVTELRRKAPRRVTIRFSRDAGTDVPAIAGATVVSATPRTWIVEISGPTGPVVAAIAGLPVEDVEIEGFRLEDYVLKLYGPCES